MGTLMKQPLIALLFSVSGLVAAQGTTWTDFIISTETGGAYWACEPSIAMNPNGTELIGGSVLAAIHRNNFSGGRDSSSWTQGKLTSSHGVYGDPIVAYGPQGRAYYLHLSNPSSKAHRKGKWLDRIVIQWSDDHGATWSDGSGIGHNPPKDQDKEGIAIDPLTGVLHVSWTEFDRYGSKKSKDHSRIRYAQSEDRGVSWSDAVTLSSFEGNCLDNDQSTEGAIPAVNPNGGVVCLWSFNDSLWINRSNDGGLTWLPQEQFVAVQSGGWTHNFSGFGRSNGMPVTAFSPDGVLHVTYGEQHDDSSWVSHISSADGGRHWSAITQLPQPESVKHHFMPWMAIDPSNGSLHVIAYSQDSGSKASQAFWSQSSDGGKTWTNQAIGTSFQPDPDHFFGDYSGIVANHGQVHMLWTEQVDSKNTLWYGRSMPVEQTEPVNTLQP